MRTRSAVVLGLSATLLAWTFASPARAQLRGNVGRQVEGQVLSNAVGGQPGYYAGQPGAVYAGQPGGYGIPTTPRQALQGMETQGINSMTGQPGYAPMQAGSATRYQVPAQFSGSTPGTTVNYGGANYVVNPDGTMSPSAAATQPAANAMRYQIPAQFSGSAPGTTINYGGANYVVNADGTMSPTSAMVAGQPGGYGYTAAPGTERRAMYYAPGTVRNQPVYASPQTTSATQYQLPAQFSESAPGTTITYGGANYVVNNGGTMSPTAR